MEQIINDLLASLDDTTHTINDDIDEQIVDEFLA